MNLKRLAKAGERMRQIRSSKPDVTWFQGPGPSDLFTRHDAAGGIDEQELTFFGRAVVVSRDRVATGLCHEGGVAGYVGKTGLLDLDGKLDAETLEAALLLLQHIPFEHPDLEAVTARIAAALAHLPKI